MVSGARHVEGRPDLHGVSVHVTGADLGHVGRTVDFLVVLGVKERERGVRAERWARQVSLILEKTHVY